MPGRNPTNSLLLGVVLIAILLLVAACGTTASGLYTTSSEDGSQLYVWDLRHPEGPLVRVYSCHSVIGIIAGEPAWEEFRLPPVPFRRRGEEKQRRKDDK